MSHWIPVTTGKNCQRLLIKTQFSREGGSNPGTSTISDLDCGFGCFCYDKSPSSVSASLSRSRNALHLVSLWMSSSTGSFGATGATGAIPESLHIAPFHHFHSRIQGGTFLLRWLMISLEERNNTAIPHPVLGLPSIANCCLHLKQPTSVSRMPSFLHSASKSRAFPGDIPVFFGRTYAQNTASIHNPLFVHEDLHLES